MDGNENAGIVTMTPTESLNEWSRVLLNRIREQPNPMDRVCRLIRYFSPQVVTAVLSSDEMEILESHRREITAVFLDLRGFTSFADSVEPEEVATVLRTYHAEMGKLIFRFEGTVEHFAGDGIMVFFNDPVPCEDHTKRAMRMALEMRERMKDLRESWLRNGYDLDLGIGVAAGFATVGNLGFEGRMSYGAVGNVTNLASRLCDEAKGGQILTTKRTLSRVEDMLEAEYLGEMRLKGFLRPVPAFNIVGVKQNHEHQTSCER
jgi:adenylate cyclase